MKPPRSHEFRDECWNVDFILVWPVDAARLCAFLAKRLPNADISNVCEDEDEEGFSGWADVYDGYYVIALNRWHGNIDDLGTLSHECNHAAMQVLFRAGVEINGENQEPLAYLQDSLFRRCLTALRGKR